MFEIRAPAQPYPGLRPFRPWEASIFFGREQHTDRLIEILAREHFLAVLGPSGSGKSSLVRAGLLPALPLSSLGGDGEWHFALVQPRDRPIRNLARALLGDAAFGGTISKLGSSVGSVPTEAMLEAELRRGPLGLIELVNDLRREAELPAGKLLVLVDQFEEIFTYAGAGGMKAEESEAFINLLLAAKEDRSAGIFVALTMRTDFLGNCVRFLDLPDAINRAQYLTPRLTKDQLVRAIGGPARVFGGDLRAELTGELVNTVAGNPDQLPVLQHVLARMWVTASKDSETPLLTLDHLKNVGGTESALGNHARDVLKDLPESARDAAQWLFRAITEQRSVEAGGQLVRRPQSLQQIAQWSGLPWKSFVPVLKAFGGKDVNFLSYHGQPGEPEDREETVVDLSHEALMRQWGTLKDWIHVENRAIQRYRNLRDRARAEATGQGSLLGGTDLALALVWQERGLGGDPVPGHEVQARPTAAWASRASSGGPEESRAEFGQVCAYIQRSQAVVVAQDRRTRLARRVQTSLAVTVFLLGIVALWIGINASQYARSVAASSLWHPLLFNSGDLALNEAEENGLVAVSRAPQEEREEFVLLGLRDVPLAARFVSRPREVLNAAVGLDPAFRDRVVGRVSRMPPAESGALLPSWILAMAQLEGEVSVDQLLDAIRKTTQVEQLSVLGKGLLKAEASLPLDGARARLSRYLKALSSAEDSDQRTALRSVLKLCRERLGAGTLPGYLEEVLQAFLASITERPFDVTSLSEVVSETALGVDGEPSDRAVVELLGACVNEAEAPFRTFSEVLSDALTNRIGRLNSAQALGLFQDVVKRIETESRTSALIVLGQTLAGLAQQLDEPRSNEMGQLVLEKLGTTPGPKPRAALAFALPALGPRMPEASAKTLLSALPQLITESGDDAEIAQLEAAFDALLIRFKDSGVRPNVDELGSVVRKVSGKGELGLRVGEAYLDALAGLESRALDSRIPEMAGMLTNIANSASATRLAGIFTQAVHHVEKPLPEGLRVGLIHAISTDAEVHQMDGIETALDAVLQYTELPRIRQLVSDVQASVDVGDRYKMGMSYLLRVVVSQLDAEGAETFIQQLVQASFVGSRDDKHRWFIRLGSLPAAVGRLSEARVRALLPLAVRALEKANDAEELSYYGPGLIACADRLDGDEVEKAARLFLKAIEKSQGYWKLRALSQGLNQALNRLDEPQTERLWDAVLTAMRGVAEEDRLRILGQALETMASRLSERNAPILDRMTVLLTEARTQAKERRSSEYLPAWGGLLGRLTGADLPLLMLPFLEVGRGATSEDRKEIVAGFSDPWIEKFSEAQVDSLLSQFADLGTALEWKSGGLSEGFVLGLERWQSKGSLKAYLPAILGVRAAARDESMVVRLGKLMVAAMRDLDQGEAGSLFESLMEPLDSEKYPFGFLGLEESLRIAWALRPESDAREWIARLKLQLDAKGALGSSAERLGVAMAGALSRLQPQERFKFLADSAVTGFLARRPDDSERNGVFRVVLMQTIPTLEPSEADRLAKMLLQGVLKATKDQDVPEGIEDCLMAAVPKILEGGPELRRQWVVALVEALGSSSTGKQTSILGSALGQTLKGMKSQELADGLSQLRGRLAITSNPEQIEVLGQLLRDGMHDLGLQESNLELQRTVEVLLQGNGLHHRELTKIVPWMSEWRASASTPLDLVQARSLVEMCRSPLVSRDAVAEVLRKDFPDVPPKAQGPWAFVRWGINTLGIHPSGGPSVAERGSRL